jgi:VCBS repeat-containing protein
VGGDKILRVGRFEYTIDEDGKDIAAIVAGIQQALTNKTVVPVAVLDEKRNRMTLYLNGAQADAVVIDLDEGPKPGELSP